MCWSFSVRYLALVCVLVVACTGVTGLPFAKKAYLNETDGLLYVGGMSYELPDTHVINGTVIDNRHKEGELALPTHVCGQDYYIDSRCNSIRGGNVRCRRSVAWPIYTRQFTCAQNEFCAGFESVNGQRRDQCVSTNYYAIQVALSSARSSTVSHTYSSGGQLGLSTIVTSSDNAYLVFPKTQQLSFYYSNGSEGGSEDASNQDPVAYNIGAGGSNRRIQITWGVQTGQIAHAYAAVYNAS